MDETCELLRQVFRTKNPLTFPVSGTGMAGMECLATNLIEPGDEAIVCINGFFGARMKDVMERCGATVHALEVPWGDIFTLEADCRRPGPAPAGQARSASSTPKPAPAPINPWPAWLISSTPAAHCSWWTPSPASAAMTARGRLGHRRLL